MCFATRDSSTSCSVITPACQWWKIKREFHKTLGEILGELQMAGSRLALPDTLWPCERVARPLFLICVLFHKARCKCPVSICYSAPKSHTHPCFSSSSPCRLVVIVVLYFPEKLMLSLSQHLQSLPAHWCWTRKCLCLWVTGQEVLSWKDWNFFLPLTTSRESDCLIRQIYGNYRASQVFGAFTLKFSPRNNSVSLHKWDRQFVSGKKAK